MSDSIDSYGRHLGSFVAATRFLARCPHTRPGARWRRYYLQADSLRLRLNYQPDPHAHVIHVRHDPRDEDVSDHQRGAYYGHVVIETGAYWPHVSSRPYAYAHAPIQEALKAFASSPPRFRVKKRLAA